MSLREGQMVYWHNTQKPVWKTGLIISVKNPSDLSRTVYEVLWDNGQVKKHARWKLHLVEVDQ